MAICTKGTHSWVLIDTLDYHVTMWPCVLTEWPTLSQNSIDSQSSVCQLRSTPNRVPAKISWLSTEMCIKCGSMSTKVPKYWGYIEGQWRVLDLGYFDRHPTEEGPNRPLYCTHDPLCLVNLLLILSKTKKTRAQYIIFK